MTSDRLPVKSKLPDVGDTIFDTMTQMAADHGAINLSQGFPNFGAPQTLVELVCQYMKSGKNQYPPMTGLPALKEKLASKLSGLYGADYDPATELTVTAGATQAIQMAITAFIHEGDEVIIFDPAYDIYAPCVQMNGGTARHVILQPPEFQIDWKEVRQRVNDQTRMIIVNTPQNPSGTVFDKADMKALASLASEQELLVLSDEVYQHMVFDGADHQSICRFPGLKERGLAAFSFGKTYHVTGWKVGYVAAPKPLTDEFRKIFQYGMFAVSSPMQHAFSKFLDKTDHYRELSDFYQQKRDLFRQILENSRFECLPCKGTYFQCASYKQISDEPDTTFVQRLIKDYGVAAIPISPFYSNEKDERIIRFCFAKTDETLHRAGQKLTQI